MEVGTVLGCKLGLELQKDQGVQLETKLEAELRTMLGTTKGLKL